VPLSVEIQENVLLAPHTTLRIGGPARYFCRATTANEVFDAVVFARRHGLKLFILGGGSNLLVSDDGFDGLVLQLALTGSVAIGGEDPGGFVSYDVAAGNAWDSFVRQTCEEGVGGIECLAGIPGLVGGTPVQNVGAYGQEVASSIHSVDVFDLQAYQFARLDRRECGFAYRTSIFNTTHKGRYVVTSVTFGLRRGARPDLSYADLRNHFDDCQPTLLEVYDAVRAIRQGKGMLLVDGDPDCRSAGSFFKNPIVPVATLAGIARALGIVVERIPNWPTADGRTTLPAAGLLDQAGFHKGFEMGPAGISSRHTLALINRTGMATCADILKLRDVIVAEVATRFGIDLEQEPVFLG
jgi:UDP-N-acetylmuramate dehydrogenase